MADSGWWDYRQVNAHDRLLSPRVRELWDAGRRGANAPYIFETRASITVAAATPQAAVNPFLDIFNPVAAEMLHAVSSAAGDKGATVEALIINADGDPELTSFTLDAANGTTPVHVADALGFVAVRVPVALAGNLTIENHAQDKLYGRVLATNLHSIAAWFHAPDNIDCELIYLQTGINADPLNGGSGETLKIIMQVDGVGTIMYFNNTLVRVQEHPVKSMPMLDGGSYCMPNIECTDAVECTVEAKWLL